MIDKTTSEIFEEIKNNKKVLNHESLKTIRDNLVSTLESALSIDQTKLVQKTTFLLKNIKRENELLDYGIDTYIYKEELQDLIKNLNMTNDKNIFLIELKNFERPIPKEVQEKIKYCKDNKLFDEYYILFTDYTKKKQNIAKNGNAKTKEKDPIIFGAFIDRTYKTTMMSERIYYIADWIDEYCDLTLEKLISIDNNIVKNIDKQRNINDLLKLSESLLEKEKVQELKSRNSFLSKFKNMFKGK